KTVIGLSSNEKTPAISTDSWGRQPRVFLPAGFFGSKNRKLWCDSAHSRAFLINCRIFPVGLSWRGPPGIGIKTAPAWGDRTLGPPFQCARRRAWRLKPTWEVGARS